MTQNILIKRRCLTWAISGMFTVLFLLADPVSGAGTSPSAPPAPAAVEASVAPPVPSKLTPEALAALSPEEKLDRAAALSAAAFFRAGQALKTGDLVLAREAHELISRAVHLDCDVARNSADAKDAETAQLALNTSLQIVETLNLILAVAANIVSTGTDADTVAAAEVLQGEAIKAQEDLQPCQETAITAGASLAAAEEAYEPPVPDVAAPDFNPPVVGVEPPINDLPPASPV